VDDVAPSPARAAPAVVAGDAPVAIVVAAALLRAGQDVVALVEPPDELVVGDAYAAELAAARDAGRYRVTDDPAACAGFAVALLTEPSESDPSESDGALSPVERYAAAVAPHLRPGGLLVVSSATAEHAGVVAAATVELLTGLRAVADYALAHLLPPPAHRRLIVSGVDADSATRAREWLAGLGLPVMPVMPVAAAEVVASLLARADRPPDERGNTAD
jgi:UDP-N-acetyl-D-mannosaminuronate dehydrogenase